MVLDLCCGSSALLSQRKSLGTSDIALLTTLFGDCGGGASGDSNH